MPELTYGPDSEINNLSEAYGSGGGFDWSSLAGYADIAEIGLDWWGQKEKSDAADAANQMYAEVYGDIAARAPIDAREAQLGADPYAPYRAGAAEQLSGILSGEIDWTQDPGYQFRQEEGQRATERAAASRGYNKSGNVMQAVSQTAQGIASQEYGTIIDRLTGLAGATPQNAIAGGQIFGGLTGETYNALLGAAGATGAIGAGEGALTSGIGSAIGGIAGTGGIMETMTNPVGGITKALGF